MIRRTLFAYAALGAVAASPNGAYAADLVETDPVGRQISTIVDPATGTPAARSRSAPAPSGLLFEPEEFDDVNALEFDVARVATALGMSVDRSEAALLGRVALRVVDDPDIGAPTVVTNPDDPNLRTLEQASGRPQMNVYDVEDNLPGVVPRRGLRLDYAAPVARQIAGLEVAVEPRANVVVGEQVSGVGGGAIVRFGRNLTKPREQSSRWYAFVGADAQALTWSLGGAAQDQVLRLEDKQMIGDYQAGIAVRVGKGDLAFGFVHREVRWNDVSRDEQFLGVTYAIRH